MNNDIKDLELLDNIKINDINEDNELFNMIMIDIDMYIIKFIIFDNIKDRIDKFKENNSNIIKLSNTRNEKEINQKISCMNKLIDIQLALFLSRIRNQLYLDVKENFNEFKEKKRVELYINDKLVLKYKNNENIITQKFKSFFEL